MPLTKTVKVHFEALEEGGCRRVMQQTMNSIFRLEHRPGIAQAERLIVATNASSGVTKTSVVPSVKLTGTARLPGPRRRSRIQVLDHSGRGPVL